MNFIYLFIRLFSYWLFYFTNAIEIFWAAKFMKWSTDFVPIALYINRVLIKMSRNQHYWF